MNAELLGLLAAALSALSVAAQSFTEIVIGIFPHYLATPKEPESVERTTRRALLLKLIAFGGALLIMGLYEGTPNLASMVIVRQVSSPNGSTSRTASASSAAAEDASNTTSDSGTPAESIPIPIYLFALMAVGGTSFWDSVLKFANAAKNVKIDQAHSAREFRAEMAKGPDEWNPAKVAALSARLSPSSIVDVRPKQ